jgi:hypothetical protein
MHPLIGKVTGDFSEKDYFIESDITKTACPRRLDDRIKRETFALESGSAIDGTRNAISVMHLIQGLCHEP